MPKECKKIRWMWLENLFAGWQRKIGVRTQPDLADFIDEEKIDRKDMKNLKILHLFIYEGIDFY